MTLVGETALRGNACDGIAPPGQLSNGSVESNLLDIGSYGGAFFFPESTHHVRWMSANQLREVIDREWKGIAVVDVLGQLPEPGAIAVIYALNQ